MQDGSIYIIHREVPSEEMEIASIAIAILLCITTCAEANKKGFLILSSLWRTLAY